MKYLLFILFTFTIYAQDVFYVNFNNVAGTANGLTSATGWNFFDDSDGYYARERGVNWDLLSAGDTILVSGTYRPNNDYGYMIYGENITGGYVYIKEDWHNGYGNAEFRNSDTLVTITPFNYAWSVVQANVHIQNCSGLYFYGLDFIVDEPRPSYIGTRSVNLSLENDSLITFDSCHFNTNGVAACIVMDTPAKITFINNLIESQYNTYTEDNDLFTWSQAGYGEHLIKDNVIINRNAYVGESGTASASDSSATRFTVTVSGANWATDLHKNANITMGGATMVIWSNDATHLYGYEWTDGDDPPTVLPKPNAGNYTIASTAHRDVMQMGYGNNASRPTTKFINNFIWVLYEQDVNSWNQMHYLGDDASHISKQNFVYINNLFVTPIDTNGNGIAVIAQNWPNASSLSKWEFYNNTFITTGGWFGNTQVMDSCIAYNNVFVTLNPNSIITLGRSDLVSVDSINYNYWSVPNWNTRTWLNNATFLWDNYVYYTWATWQAAGNDVNSLRDVNGTFEFQNIQDSVISAYTPPAILRDIGKDLSYLATKYPEIMYDIEGNARDYGSGWDIGALEYTPGIAPVDSTPSNVSLSADYLTAELNTQYTAHIYDLAGFDSAYARIDRGWYNIDGGTFKSTEWTMVYPNDDIIIVDTSSTRYSTTQTITLTIGDVSDTWTLRTKNETINPTNKGLAKGSNGRLWYTSDTKLIKLPDTSSYTPPAGEPDITPPNPPTSFVAVGGSYQTQFQTNWTFSIEESDLASIQYYEGSVNDTTTMSLITTLGAVTGYLRAGRTANTTYWAAVKAVDDSGNVSYFSNVDSATTLTNPEGGTPLSNLDLAYLTNSFAAHLYDHSLYPPGSGTTTMQEEMTAYNTANSSDGSLTRIEPDYPDQGDMIWHWNQVFFGGNAFGGTENIIAEYASGAYDILQVAIGFNSAAISYAGWITNASDTATYPQGHIENSYKYWIRNMVAAMELHPDKYWILWDIPAEVESAGNSAADVLRQANFNTWMIDTLQAGLDSYGAFPTNVYIFDIFGLLKNAGNNWMNDAYSDGTGDSHPNAAGQDVVAPAYIQEVFDKARAYRIPEPLDTTNNWYVDRDATGSANGTSWADAEVSLVNAFANAIEAGDTIFISGGSDSTTYAPVSLSDIEFNSQVTITNGEDAGYDGNVYFVNPNNTLPYAMKLLRCKNLKVNGLYFRTLASVDDSLTNKYLIRSEYGSGIIIDSCNIISNGLGSGIYTYRDTLASITNNYIEVVNNAYASIADGIHIDGDPENANGITITGNTVIVDANNSNYSHKDCIQLAWLGGTPRPLITIANNLLIAKTGNDELSTGMITTGNNPAEYLIYNNIIVQYNVQSSGIIHVANTSGLSTVKIFNNTILVSAEGAGLELEDIDTLIVKNNIIMCDSVYWTPNIKFPGIPSSNYDNLVYTDIDYNIYDGYGEVGFRSKFSIGAGTTTMGFTDWQALGYDANGIEDSVEFVNKWGTAINDYALTSGSAGINNGTDLSAYFTTDINGVIRSSWDIGALEY